MKHGKLKLEDLIALSIAVLFSLGCLATTPRSPRVTDARCVSFGMSYLNANNLQNEDADPLNFFALDTRVGLGKGMDLGLMHTWDVTKDNDGAYSTIWSDLKCQLLNRKNTPGKPTMSIGYGTAFVHYEDAELWITSFPVSIGYQGRGIIPYLTYRLEYVDDTFFPESDAPPRSSWIIGADMDLGKPDRMIPRLGIEMGFVNSLMGGKGDDVFFMSFGLTLNGVPKINNP